MNNYLRNLVRSAVHELIGEVVAEKLKGLVTALDPNQKYILLIPEKSGITTNDIRDLQAELPAQIFFVIADGAALYKIG